METQNDRLLKVQDGLSQILGRELAESLIRAGRKRGQYDLDMQLAINDGLDSVPEEKRQDALALLDALIRKDHY